MKIEIDLNKVRQDVLFRQEAQAVHGGVTLTVRQWGEMQYSNASFPDEFLIDMMKKTIEMRIAEFIQYAPDISEIKPNEVHVGVTSDGMKTVSGSFYYCSQIVDHWEEKKNDAVARAEREVREYIAEEIFSLKTDQGRKTPWNPLTPEGEKLAWGAGYAEARNQAGFIARGKNDD